MDSAVLDEIIRRIVEAVDPDQVILFGSAARDDMGPNSDVDLLVIKGGEDSRIATTRIYQNLRGVGEAWT